MKTYRLATIGDFGINKVFGPMMTLDRAEYYRDEIAKAGKEVHVVNMAEGFDYTLQKPKGWQRYVKLSV
jgi:hypothetical protein